MHALYHNDGVARAKRDEQVAKKVKELFKTGTEYLDSLSRSKASPEQMQSLRGAWNLVLELHKAALQFYHSHVERAEPFVLYLVGPPGVGKSRLMHLLMPDLCEYFNTPFNCSTDVYIRSMTAKFWDGYAFQKFVIFDDFLQSKDPNTRGEEALELIRAKNRVPFMLNMAHLEDKGSTLFSSPFLFISSNTDIPDALPVQSVAAVKRRRDVVAKISVKVEFANEYGMPDPAKIQSAFGMAVSKDIYVFEIIHALSGETLHIFKEYKEFKDHLCAAAGLLWRGDVSVMSRVPRVETPPPAAIPPWNDLLENTSESSSSSSDTVEYHSEMDEPFWEENGLCRPNVENPLVAERRQLGLSERGWEKWEEFKRTLVAS